MHVRSERSDQKISFSSLFRIGPIPTINKEFLLDTRERERTARLGLEHVLQDPLTLGEIVPLPSLLLGYASSSSSKPAPLLILFVALVLRGAGRGSLRGWDRGGVVAKEQVFLPGLNYWCRKNGGGTVCGLRVWSV